jgi:hypothetical protein
LSEDALALLCSAQRGLRSRFDDFRRALDRRDEAAYRLALSDFENRLVRWTDAEERVLLPALDRAGIAGRDPRRELRLEYVQLRELTRALRRQIEGPPREGGDVEYRPAIADTLGYAENLSRRFDAHEAEVLGVYYPAAAKVLTDGELRVLKEAAPPE